METVTIVMGVQINCKPSMVSCFYMNNKYTMHASTHARFNTIKLTYWHLTH